MVPFITRTSANINVANDLFSTQAQRDEAKAIKIIDVAIESIDTFKEHPFQVEEDEDMKKLIESVSSNGVMEAVLLRKSTPDRYEMISGHRRMFASVRNNLKTIPARIIDVSHDEAIVMMVDCNYHRENIPISQKAKAIKMKMDALKRLGKTVTYSEDTETSTAPALEVVAAEQKVSRETVRRLVRISQLNPELLELLDENKLSETPAVELSYLSAEEQHKVFQEIVDSQSSINLLQAKKLRDLHKNKGADLSTTEIRQVINKPKPNQIAKYHIPCKEVDKFIPVGTKDVTAYILKALEAYAGN